MKTLLLSLLMLVACTSKKNPRDVDDQELMLQYKPAWFTVNPDHTLLDSQGSPATHLFYDVAPDFSRDQKQVNAIITTGEASDHAYDVDLSSGQRHYSHSYCPQQDAWKQESGTFHRPPFSIGYIPRVLDQLGSPQKVIVFSTKDKKELIDLTYQRVKLVAAYVEQICREGNCLGKNIWMSRLVFIGVDNEDPSFANVNTLADFQKRFKWPEVKAYLENIDGRSFLGEQTFPLIKINKAFSLEEGSEYFRKNSIFLSENELKKIQSGCFTLYDRLWKDVGMERPEDKPARTTAELNTKLLLKEDLKKKKLPVGFAARFESFTQKYFNEMATCEKYVYHGNINRNPEAFWFYTYAGMFFRLHKEGYYFDCRKKTWQQNLFDSNGKLVYDLKKGIQECSERDIDLAMNYMPNFLKSLKVTPSFYRFVDYDSRTFGTHRKLYSWVKFHSRRYDCSNDPNPVIVRELEVFPPDVKWISRSVIDIEDELKIIY